MESAIPEGLTVFNFKNSHRIRLRTSNLAERVNSINGAVCTIFEASWVP